MSYERGVSRRRKARSVGGLWIQIGEGTYKKPGAGPGFT